MLQALLRGFSYLFHTLLTLLLLAISALALISGPRSLRLDVLPWTGATLTYVVLGASLVGLLALALALRGHARALFLLWNVAIALMLLKGYIFSGYRFSPAEAGPALLLTAGSLVALVGAWLAVWGANSKGKVSGDLLHFARANARRASAETPGSTIHNRVDRL